MSKVFGVSILEIRIWENNYITIKMLYQMTQKITKNNYMRYPLLASLAPGEPKKSYECKNEISNTRELL